MSDKEFKVLITETAAQDLRGIYEYIAYELLSPDTAEGQFARLENAVMSLKRFPERFARYGREPWKTLGLRFMPVDSYIVFYLPETEKFEVAVLRVMYGERDVGGQLG